MSRDTTFAARSREALADVALRRTLSRVTGHFTATRERTLAAWEHGATKLANGAAARLRAVENLATLLPELEEKVTALGGTVHWAEDAAAARTIILGLAQERGVTSVVKGKSMVSEEIGLNAALAASGITAFETDLGEYIVQLAHEPPSHIIAPAIHKSREDVAALFEKELGETSDGTPEMLTAIARRRLREAFLNAGMGITGVNFAVAETGAVCLLENEGNIRASTTCPPVHVALMGLEKVVATTVEAADVLQVLPKSATGQSMPAYFSVFSGARRPGETDGAREFHLVILDNGRSRIQADPLFRQLLACVRCGACLNYCPVYRVIGGHAYGATYSGPIGLLLSTLLSGGEAHRGLPAACTGCGACVKACPVGVNHGRLIMEIKRRMVEEDFLGGGDGFLASLLAKGYAFAAKRPQLFALAAGTVRRLDPELARLSRLAPLARYAAGRELPRPKEPFSERWLQLDTEEEA
jgi:L-lactate dehydrogenase complex protein LldF